MTEPTRPRARACPVCGALNGAEFDRCIRCGVDLADAAARVRPRPSAPEPRATLPATFFLAGITLVVFAGQVFGELASTHRVPVLSASPYEALRFGALVLSPAAVAAEPWRALSAVYVHFGLLHFALNMLAFFSLARIAEPAVGFGRFTTAYVVSGLVGFGVDAARSVLFGAAFGITAGASGAIFGVMGLILGWLLRRRDPRWKQFAVQAVVYSLLFGFAVNSFSSAIRIDNTAHVGGLVVGVLFGIVYAGPRRAPEALVRAGGILCIAASVASLALAQASSLPRLVARQQAADDGATTAPADTSDTSPP
ncbi:MAG TPA: rhomboid family intramembrane serine protease [Minicystis sp.]|nr:rhomboid family intramembrane serine protease [Minicystis sp.]